MKAIAQASVITPAIIGLAALAAVIVFVGMTGKKIPLLHNVRVDISLLVLIGMAICTRAASGALLQRWSVLIRSR